MDDNLRQRMESKTKKSISKKISKELKNKTILVTGGAGSIGSHLVKKILEYPVKSVRVLDIDEHALFRLNRDVNNSRFRPLLGNILDKDRVEMAGNDVDIIFHLAAIKNIEISEFNPIETIDANVIGTVNMIKMAMKNKPKRFLNISTDKSVASSTLYGATKLLGEKITSWAGIHLSPTKFATVRFGNVEESRGNVFEIWNDEVQKNKPLSITHPSMERYFFHVNEAVDFILSCLSLINSGEIFVPKMKMYKISKLANKITKNHKIIGLRKGEKLKEILLTDEEIKRATSNEKMWIIKQI
jgi:FlaA1/EpsC-like NDP-sugar epimerase